MTVHQKIDLEQLCADKGLRITEQRRVIARVLSESDDHPDVELLHERANKIDSGISIATVYRTVRLFEEAGILDRHDFGDGRARYEAAPEAHHDHLIDVETGKVVEFVDPEIEALQKQIAAKLGYRLVDHRLELYGVRLDREG
ncbi:MAG: Fur family transcriptional regulator [Nitratireductor sp.]|jgi:Fur family ferric uptake transcriptional regulator|nr:Fur family transcriptional regulator [Qipengyuania citrea]|tara:strand:+ start:5221 stop:5649 length:429 start_codon:yes stop_codon:yes gene_type:complete